MATGGSRTTTDVRAWWVPTSTLSQRSGLKEVMLADRETARSVAVGWEGTMLGFLARALGRRPKPSVLEDALREHVRQFFYSGQALSWMKPENKEHLVGELFTQLAAIETSPDPRMALRQRLTEYVIMFAQLQLLCLTEEEKAGQFFADK